MKPKIIIPAWVDNGKITQRMSYENSVVNAGGIPILSSPENTKFICGHLKPDGVLLCGGIFDLPPAALIPTGCPIRALDLSRYNQYIYLIKYAKKNKIPLFAICAGFEVMGNFLGGRVKRISGHKSDDCNLITNHSVEVIGPNKYINKQSFIVNSIHGAGLDLADSKNIDVLAKASDGTIEAIAPRKPWADFVLAVQWHPELLDNKLQNGLFKQFIQSAARVAENNRGRCDSGR